MNLLHPLEFVWDDPDAMIVVPRNWMLCLRCAPEAAAARSVSGALDLEWY